LLVVARSVFNLDERGRLGVRSKGLGSECEKSRHPVILFAGYIERRRGWKWMSDDESVKTLQLRKARDRKDKVRNGRRRSWPDLDYRKERCGQAGARKVIIIYLLCRWKL
jgi:hypothetical protein